MAKRQPYLTDWYHPAASSLALLGLLIFSAPSQAQSPQGQLITVTNSGRHAAAAPQGKSGGFVVVWQNDEGRVKARLYNSSGTLSSTQRVSHGVDHWAPEKRFARSVATSLDGGFLVPWSIRFESVFGGMGSGIFVSRYDGNGNEVDFGAVAFADETPVLFPAGPAAATLSDGSYLVSYSTKDRRLKAVRVSVADNSTLALDLADDAKNATIATALGRSEFVATWLDSESKIHIKHYSNRGVPRGAEYVAGPGSISRDPILALAGGDVILAWSTDAAPHASTSYIQRIGFDGVLKGTITIPRSSRPALAALATGKFGAAFDSDDTGIAAQVFDSAGRKIGDRLLPQRTSTSARSPGIASLDAAHFIIVWQGRDGAILAQRYSLP